MKKVLLGMGIGTITTIVGIMIFIGVISGDKYSQQNVASQYWGW